MKLVHTAIACAVLLCASTASAARILQAAPVPAPLPDSFSSIASFAASTNFSSFQAALNASGLLGMLAESDIAYTIFAPTDKAIGGFLATQNLTLSDLLDSDYLLPIEAYYVVPYLLPVSDMTNGAEIATLLGQNLTLAEPIYSYSAFTVNAAESSADIIKADIAAGQSLIHVLDAVLVPSMEALEDNVHSQVLTAGLADLLPADLPPAVLESVQVVQQVFPN